MECVYMRARCGSQATRRHAMVMQNVCVMCRCQATDGALGKSKMGHCGRQALRRPQICIIKVL